MPKICVTVAGARLGELRRRALHAARDCHFVELRLDYLAATSSARAFDSPATSLHKVDGICELVRELRSARASVIVTLRTIAAGGQYGGTVEDQLQILAAAARSGASLVDLEIESAEQLGAASLRGLRKLAPLLVSFHDYRETPAGLRAAWRRLQRFPADLYKLVTVAHNQLDNAAVLDLASGARGKLVAFTMGELGRPTRVLCLTAGSPFTYACPETGGVPGIGQIPANVLRNMYRAHKITPRTRVMGVVGHPVGHSLSPVIHNAAFAALHLDMVYVAFDTEDFLSFWNAWKSRLSGLSVTIPHKVAAAQATTHLDGVARRAGAANTLVRRAGKWMGYNTDVLGVLDPLRRCIELKGAHILVAGAGGAGRAAIAALSEAGCRVTLVSRSLQKASALAAELGVEFMDRADLASRQFDAILHATPLGMTPDTDSCFFLPQELNAPIVFETVYTPVATRLARMARKRGRQVIPGWEMFLSQAAVQFRLWTGRNAPRKVMQSALLGALPR